MPKKSNKGGNPYEEQIQHLLKKNRGKRFSKKEISQALSIKKSTYHLFQEALLKLQRDGKLTKLKGAKYIYTPESRKIQGVLQMTRKGFAFVLDDAAGEEIFIANGNLNTAFDGDEVEIEIFARRYGKNKEGQVTGVLRRARTEFVGTYRKSEFYGFVTPDNSKVYRDFAITEGAEKNARDGQKVVVELSHWKPGQLNPEGRIIEVIGFPDEPGVDVAVVARGFGLPLQFRKTTERQAREIVLDIDAGELGRRRDLRDEMVFTIDPPDARDFDDAVSLEKLDNGNYRLGVHIADVSHFVKEGTELDDEALERGTSVYLVDRVIPMLPEYLSNKLCSLQPNEDRLTYSCFMDLNAGGKVVAYEIVKAVINSKRRFTYQEVQDIIDDPRAADPLAPVIREMHALSRKLREKRMQNGSVDFSTPEVKFKLDERGQPIEIIPVKPMHSNQLIEEFMLMANQTVARHITLTARDNKPYPFVYRVHEKPDREKLEKFREFLKALGYKFHVKRNVTPADFQEILNQVKDTKDESLVSTVALRTMMKANYDTENKGHFGLAFQYYSHFTSPIRRYPDLMVHRLLEAYRQPKNAGEQHKIKKQLKKICEIASQRERQAMEAERESVAIKQIEWITQHRNDIFEGIISGVTGFGIFVETQPYLIEGLIRMENLSDDYYIYQEKTYTMTGRENGRVFRLGDPVRVKIANINPARREIDFVMADENV